MIIKGGACKGAGRVAAHLLDADQNEHAEVTELRGVMAGDLRAALREMETAALCSRTRKPLYHASINPRVSERMDAGQWAEAIDQLESALGFSGQPRAVIAHVKDGREHRHVVWLRVDLSKGRAISDSHNFRKHEAVARDLERSFGFERVQGAHVERQGRRRPIRSPGHDEMQQAAHTGISPKAAATLITALWRGTATGKEFSQAVTAAGWTLCRGERRDFVLLDPQGGVHSLARRIDGAKAKDIRTRMADIDSASLPSVKEARAALPKASRRATDRRRRAPAAGTARMSIPALSSRRRRFTAKAKELTRSGPRNRPWSRPQRRAGMEAAAGQTPRQRGKGEPLRRPDAAPAPEGLFVKVSRQRLDYAHPCIQPGANANPSPRWTRTRIEGLGVFRAQAVMIGTPVHSPRVEAFERPERPDAAGPAEANASTGSGNVAASCGETGEAGSDEGLGGLLAAIAAEVQARAACAQAVIAAQFGAAMEQVAKTLPPNQVAGAIAALKLAMQGAMKAVQEAAAAETKGRQQAGTTVRRRRRSRTLGQPASKKGLQR